MNITGTFDGFYTKRLYLYLSQRAKGKNGYYSAFYADMAHLVGLPWLESESRRASLEWLNCALDNLASHKLIYVRPSPVLGCVQVWMCTNPEKLHAQHGGLYLDRLLKVDQTADPWATMVGGDNG